MQNYIITIEETVSGAFPVMAENTDEVIKTAVRKYYDGTFELSPGNLTSKQMQVENADNKETTEWFSF